MRISLDWITVKLTPEFNLELWRSIASAPLVSRETGEKIGIACTEKQWKFNRYGLDDYVSAFGNGTQALAECAAKFDLRVSRIDVAIDTACAGKPEQALEELEQKLDDFYDRKGISITRGEWNGRASKGKGNRTLLYGKRSSAYQIRAYSRHSSDTQDGWVIRCEFQLRNELARAFWQEASADFKDALTLRNATSQLEATIFGMPLLGVGDLENDSKLELPELKRTPNTERWVRMDVLKAIIRYFDETGVNLAQALLNDFNQHIIDRAIVAEQVNASSGKLADGSTSKALKPMHYTGSKRAEMALKKYFDD